MLDLLGFPGLALYLILGKTAVWGVKGTDLYQIGLGGFNRTSLEWCDCFCWLRVSVIRLGISCQQVGQNQ